MNRTAIKLSANQWAFANISRYQIQAHKDAADSRISDDSRDKWPRAQPKYGGIEQKGARTQDDVMQNLIIYEYIDTFCKVLLLILFTM